MRLSKLDTDQDLDAVTVFFLGGSKRFEGVCAIQGVVESRQLAVDVAMVGDGNVGKTRGDGGFGNIVGRSVQLAVKGLKTVRVQICQHSDTSL